MLSKCVIAVGLGLVLLPTAGRAEEWPQFRGANLTGVTAEKALATEWGPEKNVGWKIKLPGYGWSSPVIWGDKVFVTTAVTDKQRKPLTSFAGFGGFGGGPGAPGGPKGGPGGPGRFGGFPQPGQLLPSFLQDRLKLTAEQKEQIAALQKEVDAKLAAILTDEQKKQLKDMRGGFRPGGPGGFGGPGGGGGLGGFGSKAPDVVYKWELYCLSAADGKVLWKRTAAEGKPAAPVSVFNTYASETPVTDGERVYAYFGNTGLFCYDLSGKLLWKADLGVYRTTFNHGTASSPVLGDGRLFILCDNEEKSFLSALDARTGRELWRTPRSEKTGWSTPLIWKNKMRNEVVCVGSPYVRSYDPATGKQLWKLAGMSGQAKASPVASANLLFVGTGGGFEFGGFGGGEPGAGGGFGGTRPFFAIKAGASGDITPPKGGRSTDAVAWQLPKAGPSTATPLLYQGLLYVLEERGGILACYDAATGKQVYKERLAGARGFTASPLASAGKVYCLDDAGTTYVVQAGRDFKLLAQNRVDETCWASPAVAGGAIFLRTIDHFYCIRP
jgi:outer membrane protein assembly factor BamB